MADTRESDTAAIRDLLTWCRSSGFSVSRISVGIAHVDVTDLRIEAPAAPAEKAPRDIHEAYAAQFGITPPPDEPEDDE